MQQYDDPKLPHDSAERLSIGASDGHVIDIQCWRPHRTPRAVVQVAHGMAEHGGRYARLAQRLMAKGVAVYVNDHRGHGARAAQEGDLGTFGPAGFAAVVEDMGRVSHFIHEVHPGTPLILIGHSMGSFASQVYMLDFQHMVQGIALSGSTATDILFAHRGLDRRPEDHLARIRSPRTRFDWLSRDHAEVERYAADPLCGFAVSRESMASIHAVTARTARPGAFYGVSDELPVYLFTGDEDPVNNYLQWFHPLVERLKDAGIKHVETMIYPGARHETLNEINREQVTEDLTGWMDRVLCGLRPVGWAHSSG